MLGVRAVEQLPKSPSVFGLSNLKEMAQRPKEMVTARKAFSSQMGTQMAKPAKRKGKNAPNARLQHLE